MERKINLTFRGDEYRVEYIHEEDDLHFAIKRNISELFDEELAVRKFKVLRNYLKNEGFFEEYFKKHVDNW